MTCDAGFCGLPAGVTCALCAAPDACPRCGQLGSMCGTVCTTCRGLERQPQGKALALFTPAPTVMAGQEGLF